MTVVKAQRQPMDCSQAASNWEMLSGWKALMASIGPLSYRWSQANGCIRQSFSRPCANCKWSWKAVFSPVTTWQGYAAQKAKAWGLRGCLVANAEDGAVFYRQCGMREGGGGEWASSELGQRVSWVQQEAVNCSPVGCRWGISLLFVNNVSGKSDAALFQVNKETGMNEGLQSSSSIPHKIQHRWLITA